MPPGASATGVSITNPLVLYRSLLATGRITADPAQHRLAIHLQQLYEDLKDYEPTLQYEHKLRQISGALGRGVEPSNTNAGSTAAKTNVFSYLTQKSDSEKLALTRVLTSHEAALEMSSPKGLMLHGEVGTGKSMLIDLFADCLPNRKKKRWHFTTFMLETTSKLEQLRRSRLLSTSASFGSREDYSLLWLAHDLINTSPIIFLDEFQLPDRAASKIMTNLMTSFFQLGGVLVATSNRMPEELAKAAGMHFETPEFAPKPGSFAARLGIGRSRTSNCEGMYGGMSEFTRFLEILRARCDVWEMENGKDYRRQEAELDSGMTNVSRADTQAHLDSENGAADDSKKGEAGSSFIPKQYFVRSQAATGEHQSWLDSFGKAQSTVAGLAGTESPERIEWSPDTLVIYGRSVKVPRQLNGVTCWTFEELCCHPFGPADYVSMAAKYHTFIILDIPALTILQKNEARRLISLLDALYEARCKLMVSADRGPDEIFFPDTRKHQGEDTIDQDAIYAETIAEVYQDATAPFRPNISSYTGASSSEEEYRYTRDMSSDPAIAADQEDYQYSSTDPNPLDQLEDDPPNRASDRNSSGRNVRNGMTIKPLTSRRSGIVPGDRRAAGPDFQKAGIFTGEDEKFAYKRARSRLWEMCGSRWWARGENGDLSWWKPLDLQSRVWENPTGPNSTAFPTFSKDVPASGSEPISSLEGLVGERSINEKQDEVLFTSASPFRVHEKAPPKFGWQHAWGLMTWGKRTGNWGKGVDGVQERNANRAKIRGWPTGERDLGDHDDIEWENGRQVRYILKEREKLTQEKK